MSLKALSSDVVNPLLKWPGGKRKLVKNIEAAFGEPCAGVYVEPFLGSASVYLARASTGTVTNANLSDLNPKLMAFHRAVRDDVDGVLQELSRLPVEEVTAPLYYANREDYRAGPHEGPAHAARLLWINKSCFNGLFRESKGGVFNAAWNHEARVSIPSETHLRAVSRLLQPAALLTLDFAEMLPTSVGAADQVYADPPYLEEKTGGFTGYNEGGFDVTAHRRLAYLLRDAAREGAKVVVSGHANEATFSAYERFSAAEVFDVQRSISRGPRKKASEVLLVYPTRPETEPA